MPSISNLILVTERLCLGVIEPRVNDGKSLEKQRHGGYLCVLDDIDPHLPALARVRIGGPKEGKQTRYADLSEEKARRLASNPQHPSSWQSRDIARDYYGGAVRCEDGTILSFSGSTEEADEALMLLVARFCNLLTAEEADEIAGISNNELYREAKRV